MQSMHIGLPVIVSINTLAGCTSFIYLPIGWAASLAAFSIATCSKASTSEAASRLPRRYCAQLI